MTPNLHTILRDHVSLSVTCLDRLYVNGYVPTLQTSGHLCYFLKEHLGNPIPSPALFAPLRDRFVQDIERFAKRNEVPVVYFERGERKDDVAAERRKKFDRREGVVFIGVAQEKASSFKVLRGALVDGPAIRLGDGHHCGWRWADARLMAIVQRARHCPRWMMDDVLSQNGSS